MSEPWRYVLEPRAMRDMEDAPVRLRERIFNALDRLVAEDPPRGDTRKLAGAEDEWRLRVGA